MLRGSMTGKTFSSVAMEPLQPSTVAGHGTFADALRSDGASSANAGRRGSNTSTKSISNDRAAPEANRRPAQIGITYAETLKSNDSAGQTYTGFWPESSHFRPPAPFATPTFDNTVSGAWRSAAPGKRRRLDDSAPSLPVHSWLDDVENSVQARSHAPFDMKDEASWLSQGTPHSRGPTSRLDISRLALSTRSPSQASAHRSALSEISVSSSRLKITRRTKAQLTSGHYDHRCSDCNKGFATRSELSHHTRYHTPSQLRPFACEDCTKRFLFAKDLHRHRTTHAARSLFCPYSSCSSHKGFARNDHLYRHLRGKHGVEDVYSDTQLAAIGRQWLSSAVEDLSTRAEHQSSVLRQQPSLPPTMAAEERPDPGLSSHGTPSNANQHVRPGHESGHDSSGLDAPAEKLDQRGTIAVRGVSQAHVEAAFSAAEVIPALAFPNSERAPDESSNGVEETQPVVLADLDGESSPAYELLSDGVGVSSSSLSSESVSAITENECDCLPEECHADACPPEELDGGRRPDIRKLIALVARYGSEQSAASTTNSSQGHMSDTAKRLDRAANSFLKRPVSGGDDNNDDGNDDSRAPKKIKHVDTQGPKRKQLYRCPVGAGCDLVILGMACFCCKWDGNPKFCHVRSGRPFGASLNLSLTDYRQHIKREHVNVENDLFHQYEGHTTEVKSFGVLDEELLRMKAENASGARKWRFTYQFLHSESNPDEVPSPCKSSRL